jgi:Xaa-Pro aminopeptidase
MNPLPNTNWFHSPMANRPRDFSPTTSMPPPFDTPKLDRLLDEAGVDLLLAVTKHNVQYLLGGYRYFFFAHADAIGTGRYLPIVGYFRGRPERAFYVGAGNEAWGLEVFPVWIPNIVTRSWTSVDSAAVAAEFIRKAGLTSGRIAIELSFFPADSMDALRSELPNTTFIEALPILEELRAVKTKQELEYLKTGAAAIVDSMLAAFQSAKPGISEAQLVEDLRLEQSHRGLTFDYALIASGLTFGRAPSNRAWNPGETLSLDTAGYCHGYLADMARMAVMGQPTQLMREILNEIRFVQDQTRVAIAPGRLGREIYEVGRRAIEQCEFGKSFGFVAHGMGLIAHEAPRLRHNDEIGYDGAHAERALEAGMVLSIETGIKDPEAGFIKLEDTVIVTESGWEAYGDWGRDWNEVQL